MSGKSNKKNRKNKDIKSEKDRIIIESCIKSKTELTKLELIFYWSLIHSIS